MSMSPGWPDPQNSLKKKIAECKTRMISFRVTEEEYDRFRDVCFTRGISSVSELARAAIDMMFQQTQHVPHGALESRVADLEGRLQELSVELKKLHAH